MAQTKVRFGIRGGQASEIILPGRKASILATCLERIFIAEESKGKEEVLSEAILVNKEWIMESNCPRTGWTSSKYFISLEKIGE